MTTHTYTHTGEKPFPCTHPNCGRSFSVLSNLRRHLAVCQKNVEKKVDVTKASKESSPLIVLQPDHFENQKNLSSILVVDQPIPTYPQPTSIVDNVFETPDMPKVESRAPFPSEFRSSDNDDSTDEKTKEGSDDGSRSTSLKNHDGSNSASSPSSDTALNKEEPDPKRIHYESGILNEKIVNTNPHSKLHVSVNKCGSEVGMEEKNELEEETESITVA